MSRIPSIFSLVDPAPYLVDLEEEEEEEDDDDDYYLQGHSEAPLSLGSSPPAYPYSPQPVASSSPVEAPNVLGSDEEESDSVHGAYEILSDTGTEGGSDASIYRGVYGPPYSEVDDHSASISDSSSPQSLTPSPLSVDDDDADNNNNNNNNHDQDSDIVSLPLSPSLVSAASPSSPASPDSGSVSGSAVDLDLDLDLDSLASASEPVPASASSRGPPDRAPQRRLHRQSQANLHGLHRRDSATPDIHPNRRLPGDYSYLQPRLGNHLAPRRSSRANHQPLDNFSPDNELRIHRHPHPHSRPRGFPAHTIDLSQEDDHTTNRPSRFANLRRSSSQLDLEENLEEQEEELALHLRLRRARRAARIAREVERPERRRASRANNPQRRLIGGDWGLDPEESAYVNNMDLDIDDELVEVVYQGAVPAPPTPPRRQQRHLRHQRQQDNHNQQVDVIDLTEEPDSPVLHRHQPVNILRNRPPFHHHDSPPYRNPRRHMSQNGRTPSLNRSDGSLLNGNANGNGNGNGNENGNANANAAIIDLTIDSPDDNIPANRRLPPPAPAPAHGQRDQHNHLFGRNFMGSIRGLLPGLLAYGNFREADIQLIGAAPAIPMNANPLAGNPPDFNYQANGFGGYGGRQPTPKPDFEAPPPARAGFTRDTGPDKVTEEDQVFVCPSCDEELKYSAENDDDTGGRPAKRARTKKDREEHHFWAVKACGHVYCKSCYDNRKKHSKGKDSAAAKTGFRFQPSETARSVKIFCAVDDCESEVSPNNAWVGIFM